MQSAKHLLEKYYREWSDIKAVLFLMHNLPQDDLPFPAQLLLSRCMSWAELKAGWYFLYASMSRQYWPGGWRKAKNIMTVMSIVFCLYNWVRWRMQTWFLHTGGCTGHCSSTQHLCGNLSRHTEAHSSYTKLMSHSPCSRACTHWIHREWLQVPLAIFIRV